MLGAKSPGISASAASFFLNLSLMGLQTSCKYNTEMLEYVFNQLKNRLDVSLKSDCAEITMYVKKMHFKSCSSAAKPYHHPQNKLWILSSFLVRL